MRTTNNVNLTKRIDTPTGKRFCPVVVSGNGRIKPDWVTVKGHEERHPEGAYYIEWYKEGRRHRESVGGSAANAVARQLRKEAELKAQAQGIVLVSEEEQAKRKRIDTAISDFIDETKISKKKATLTAYSKTLEYFSESCKKTYLDEIERIDLLRYSTYLRGKSQAPRTVFGNFTTLIIFLKAYGITGLVKKNDWPRYVTSEVKTYEKEDLDNFFSVCYSDEKVWFEFFLMTGMREQEVIYCTWKDINFKQSTVSMRWKPTYDWTPKAYKEREIPVPSKLIDSLQTIRPKGDSGLVFHTASGKPKHDFLDSCKTIAKRAGLNPKEFWLHKFRATFATRHLQAGVDLRTVQAWLGHTDLESTVRYLRPARGAEMQGKVNATFG